jgi:hypothetical protein
MRKILGYGLLVLSCVAWGIVPTLPFFDISVGQAAAATTGLIIVGEASFFLGVLLLGRDVWEKIKALFRTERKEEGRD